ncbi:UDP-glucosyltransferase 2-like isoform X1 [Ostrinia nubilalis]|uniref:UDP-glucosyltransferase 2-like isoform X1 n=1 Tax=Ostrinia nubilalis TaxID=29057 RepID=UPI00308255CE
MPHVSYLFVALCISSGIGSEAARILAYFPTPSISHQVVFRSLMQELAKRGHEVTVVTTDPVFTKTPAPPNLKEVDLHDLSYETWREEFIQRSSANKDDIVSQMKVIFKLINDIMEKQLFSAEVKNVLDLKKNKYDLVIVEAYARQLMVLAHLFKTPLIQFSSFGGTFDTFSTVGAPVQELLYPSNVRQKLYNLTTWDKVTELAKFYQLKYYYDTQLLEEENAMLKRVFGDVPSIKELSNNVDLLFLNIHPIWEGSRPVPPNVIHIHGIHEKSQRDLPNDLKTYLDSSKHGVIYISFGTNVKPSLLPPEKIKIMVNVMSKLKYDVLWKWDKDDMEGKSENIKLAKWLPQSDLLRHPNIKLFITQGGLQSTDEAINAGVPLIGIPMHGDQWYNVENYVHHKIGLRINMDTMSEESLREAVKKVTEDQSYRQNIVRLRSLMKDQTDTPLERAVWWTEYVLRHSGARHLRSPSANMPWHQYYELELICTVLGVILVCLFVVVIALVKLVKGLKRVLGLQVKVKRS